MPATDGRPTMFATTLDSLDGSPDAALTDDDASTVVALVIAFDRAGPERVGDVAFVAPQDAPVVLGRGDGTDDPAQRLRFWRQRPGSISPTAPLQGRALSRRQLLIWQCDGGLRVQRVGRRELRVNGQRRDVADTRPGDVVRVGDELVLVCVERQAHLGPSRFDHPAFAFGAPDEHGIIGESAATWRLRDHLAFAAATRHHVLICGASGVGKELVARAIHQRSTSARGPFVSRNAATFPDGLIDAEMFGNSRNYPNVGMAERVGLVGAADGGTLFLDEIGELPVAQQAHLLRVLDRGGEYQRLGESTTRHSNLRVIGATNRDPRSLKHDFVARMTIVVDVPPLTARREDIAFILRHLATIAARAHPDLAAGPLPTHGPPTIALSASFVEEVLMSDLSANVRSLSAALWRALQVSRSNVLSARGPSDAERRSPKPSSPSTRAAPPSPDDVRRALDQNDGSVPAAALALGLRSRFVLYRLMKAYGMATARTASAAKQRSNGFA